MLDDADLFFSKEENYLILVKVLKCFTKTPQMLISASFYTNLILNKVISLCLSDDIHFHIKIPNVKSTTHMYY